MSGDLEDFLRRAAQRRQAKAAEQKQPAARRQPPQYSDRKTERVARIPEDEVLTTEVDHDPNSIAARMQRVEEAKRAAEKAEAEAAEKLKKAHGGRTRASIMDAQSTGHPVQDLIRTLQRPGVEPFASTEDAIQALALAPGSASVIGTPDDLIERVIEMQKVTGGYGVAIGFVNDWASPANTAKSWDMVARYVIPEVNGQLTPMRESNEFVVEHREYFQRAQTAILNKINEHERAAETFRTEGVGGRAPIAAHSGPSDDEAEAITD